MMDQQRIFTGDGRTAYRCPWHLPTGERCELSEGDPKHGENGPGFAVHQMRPNRALTDSEFETLIAPYPSALEFLASPESFDPDGEENTLDRFTRELTGSAVEPGVPTDNEDVWAHWVEWVCDRVLSRRDFVGVVDGNPGEGKSTFGTIFLTKIAARLGDELDIEPPKVEVVYRLSELIEAVYRSSRARPGIVLVDEAVLTGMQSGAGLTQEGKLVDRIFSVARIKSAVILCLIPSIHGLASMVRSRRACWWGHTERRGRLTVFVGSDRLSFENPRSLPMVKAKWPWPRIEFESLEDDPSWAAYEGTKIEVVDRTLVDANILASELERKAGLRPANPSQMNYVVPGRVGAEAGGDTFGVSAAPCQGVPASPASVGTRGGATKRNGQH